MVPGLAHLHVFGFVTLMLSGFFLLVLKVSIFRRVKWVFSGESVVNSWSL